MKKTILFLCAACLFSGACTSKEQDEKIKSFWMGQFIQAMVKYAPKQPGGKIVPPIQLHKPNAHPAAAPTQAVTAKPAPKPAPVQVLDVTMDDDALPGKAPYAERVQMKRAWTLFQLSNQNTLRDIQNTFGDQVKDKAFYITINTEKKLKQAAATAANYRVYAAKQKQLLAEQDQALQQLMMQNKASIKRIKKMPGAH